MSEGTFIFITMAILITMFGCVLVDALTSFPPSVQDISLCMELIKLNAQDCKEFLK